VRPIVIAAGGTGGHFFPAEALAEVLVARGHRVVLMTDARSAGLRPKVFEGRERFVIAGAGLAGRSFVSGARGGIGLARGIVQARRILGRLGACAVIGFGGYPCVAPVLAARTLGRQRPGIVLHEQNAVLGRANRALARFCDLLALSFANTLRVPAQVRTKMVGNPVRDIFVSRPYASSDEHVRLLVLGGSLGARVFSDVVPQTLALLPAELRSRLTVTEQCRPEDIERVQNIYARDNIAADLAPFFHDVADRLAAAHLVVARAGASTVAELAAVGRPSILVPLPHAIDDHQTANARALADAGAAWVVPQAEFDAASLAQRLTTLLQQPEKLTAAAQAAGAQAHHNAAQELADAVERLAAERVP
jgi:UDP-N-acetylglucosamine--N-acetylmuramyl-(pentapeptide) pyrophosphoryl-undecaprenol N-acetylglucosamine transferase